jgi:hypothetical protein
MNMNKKNCNVGCPDCEEVCKTKNTTKKSNTEADAPKYQCAICGKNYNTIEERIKCESTCLAEHKAAEEKKQREILETEKQTRYDHIKGLLSEVNDEIKSYLDDYGTFRIDTNYYYLNYIFNHKTFWFDF